MATVIFDSLTDHSPLDGTNTAILGSAVDLNPQIVAKIMDGTTQTDMATDAAVDARFTQSRGALRLINLDNAAGAIGDALTIEWDPADGGQMTDNSSGVGVVFKMPDASDNQDIFARIAAICLDDTATAEDGELSFQVMLAGTVTEIMTVGSLDVQVGGGYGSTGVTVSTAGVIQANGAITSDGAVTGATLAGTVSTAAQNSITAATALASVGALNSGSITSGFANINNGSSTLDTGAATLASLTCTAAGTFGGGYGATGATISTAGVIQANGAITSDGAVTGATLAGTVSTATQNSITTATSLASVGTITSGTWSGVIDGSCTMTVGSDATGDVYFRDASGFLERLAASNDGYVLTSTGAGSIPAWEAVPGGSSAFSADVTVANGYGLVVGGTAQQTISDGGGATDVVPEVQILGTATADMTALIGGWSETATRLAAPTLALLKSGNAAIASHTVVTDDEILGSIIAYGDDGTDYESPAAAIEFAVDGTPGAGDMPGRIVHYTSVDGGEVLTERMRLDALGRVSINEAALSTTHMAQAGLCVNNGTEVEMMVLKNANCAHDMTDFAETDDCAHFATVGAFGGLKVRGFGDGIYTGLKLHGTMVTVNTTDTTASDGCVSTNAVIKSGTSVTTTTATGNVFIVRNNDITRVIVKGDGTVHASDTSWATALDDIPDALAARAYTTEMAKRQGEGLLGGLNVHAPELVKRMEEQGIVTKAEIPGKGWIPGHRFLNVQKGIKFAWDMGFQQMDYLGELMKVLSSEQRAALPEQMQSHFAMLEQHKAIELEN